MRLVETSPDQARDRDAVTHAAWGTLLTREQYMQREERLRAHAWPRVALRAWLLVNDGGRILASCETYRMRSVLAGASGATYAVASVFVEPEHRGRGYATTMMTLLTDRVRQIEPSAHALALYSDVGAPIYERVGYVAPRPAFDRVWPALRGPVGADLLSEPIDVAAPDDRFVVWPEAAQLDWHRQRDRIYADLLARPRLASAGARIGDGCIFWTKDHTKDRLLILLWNGENLPPLVEAARRVAAAEGLATVVMWDQQRASGGTLVPRESSLPMLLAIDPTARAPDWTTIPRGVWV